MNLTQSTGLVIIAGVLIFSDNWTTNMSLFNYALGSLFVLLGAERK